MKPRLLDLFCGAGGCSVGYARAGFEVVGVDAALMPNYPFEFHQADAMDVLTHLEGCSLRGQPCGTYPWLELPDAVHASPPCHDHSNVSGRNRKASGEKGTGWMLDATVASLSAMPLPWVVENVETADMPAGAHRVKLCGSSFGLDVRRHRWFASNLALMALPCHHARQTPRFRSLDSRRPPGALASVVGVHGHLNYPGEKALREEAMGIDWMTTAELSQAIPPAYTQYLGEQLAAHLELRPVGEPGGGTP